MQPHVQGIVLYTIEANGCLNGVFTNSHTGNTIYNEIAKRRDSKERYPLIEGTYDCYYFDDDRQGHEAVLKIDPLIAGYEFTWEVDGKPWFKGTGYRMNQHQLAVSYWSIP
jgi:hypothetical protein